MFNHICLLVLQIVGAMTIGFVLGLSLALIYRCVKNPGLFQFINNNLWEAIVNGFDNLCDKWEEEKLDETAKRLFAECLWPGRRKK